MQIQVISEKQMLTTKWSGGRTTQCAIYPPQCVYADRDFLWRVSSATVELQESDFTVLPEYDRLITTIQGNIKLQHEGEAMIELEPYAVHGFDGAIHTHSWGVCRDFNLMLRKGQCSGQMRPIRLEQGEELKHRAKENCSLLLYLDEGAASIQNEGKIYRPSAGQCVEAALSPGELFSVHAIQPIQGILCTMICKR